MQADGGELDGEAAGEVDAALDGFEELGDVGVAGVEAGVGVDDADDGPGEGVFRVAEGFDEDFAQEEGEVGIAVGGEALSEADGGGRV